MDKLKKFRFSKTRYVQGIRCESYLWLGINKKNLSAKHTANETINLEEGNFVGELATRHPNYKENDKYGSLMIDTLDEEQSLIETKTAMNDPAIKFIYEAAFLYVYKDLKCFIRVDILEKNLDGTVNFVEVKSSSSQKISHIYDIAFQKWVIENSKTKVKNCFLMHMNSDYNRQRELNIKELFSIENMNNEIKIESLNIETNLSKFNNVTLSSIEPTSIIGSKCKSPHMCPFYENCHKDITIDSVQKLSRVSKTKLAKLKENGIKYIKDIPSNFPLTQKQAIQREAAIIDKSIFQLDMIQEYIDTLVYPLYHLDFEAYNKAVPLFKSIKPNGFVTFQASLHIESQNGNIEHKEFIESTTSDPRLKMINFLLNNIKDKGSIVVYNKSFEKCRLQDLQIAFPEFKKDIQNIIDRLWDLATPFGKSWFYKHEMEGSSSIKKVLPAIVPSFSYDKLNIKMERLLKLNTLKRLEVIMVKVLKNQK